MTRQITACADSTDLLPQVQAASKSDSTCTRQEFQFSVHDPAHEAAGVAVVAALYDNTEHLKQLSPPLLVWAAYYAADLESSWIADFAVQLLLGDGGAALSAEALEELGRMSAVTAGWPSSMLPLLPAVASEAVYDPNSSTNSNTSSRVVENILLAAFAVLEQVCKEQHLLKMLLQLPLPAMQLLLSSDQLVVSSEDMVLYIAGQYLLQQPGPGERYAAADGLGYLIRCPHLSQFQLLAQAVAPSRALASLSSQLRRLPFLLLLPDGRDEMQLIEGAPASWQRGPRAFSAHAVAGGVVLEWEVLIEDVKRNCRAAMAGECCIDVTSPSSTFPLSGLAFQLLMDHDFVDGQGVQVGVYCMPRGLAEGVPYQFAGEIRVEAGGQQVMESGLYRGPLRVTPDGDGWPDFFDVGCMSGDGWDEDAWVAQGLPKDGSMRLKLHVQKVLP